MYSRDVSLAPDGFNFVSRVQKKCDIVLACEMLSLKRRLDGYKSFEGGWSYRDVYVEEDP